MQVDLSFFDEIAWGRRATRKTAEAGWGGLSSLFLARAEASRLVQRAACGTPPELLRVSSHAISEARMFLMSVGTLRLRSEQTRSRALPNLSSLDSSLRTCALRIPLPNRLFLEILRKFAAGAVGT